MTAKEKANELVIDLMYRNSITPDSKILLLPIVKI